MKRLNVLFVFMSLCLFVSYVSLSLCGCGQNNPSPTPTGNYTIMGKVGSITANGVSISSVLPVTHVVAIGADNAKYLAEYDSSTGTFSIRVSKGIPYAVGFYNQGGGKITLLGYLQQSDVNWHSLPIIETITNETNLGTIEVNMTSVEAIPSISLNDLLSQFSMTSAEANMYGKTDGIMSTFTNVDVDQNGIFDFQEGKGYLLQIVVGTTSGPVTGEITKMLNQFNTTYSVVAGPYQLIFHASETGVTIPSNGTTGTIKFPTTIYGANGIPRTYLAGAVWGASGGKFWNFMGDPSVEVLTQCELTTPEVVPSGSYSFEVTGKGTYTFQNVVGSPIAAYGTTEGIIYPAFKMVVNSSGYVTEIDYKWMVRENGAIRDATAAEVKAMIVETAMNSNNGCLISPSPSIGVVLGSYPPPSPDPNYKTPKKIARDSSSVDVTDWNIKFSDIAMFSCDYNLNSNLSVQFMFGM